MAADLEDRLKALMLRGQAGDTAAWRELLSVLSGRFRTYFARRMDAGSPDVEDLVQETLMAVHRRWLCVHGDAHVVVQELGKAPDGGFDVRGRPGPNGQVCPVDDAPSGFPDLDPLHEPPPILRRDRRNRSSFHVADGRRGKFTGLDRDELPVNFDAELIL